MKFGAFQAALDELYAEIHELCEALAAVEGWVVP